MPTTRLARHARRAGLTAATAAIAAATLTTGTAGARATAAVWPQFRLSASHSGDNTLERTLRRGNVS
jgi:hypothetical protein